MQKMKTTLCLSVAVGVLTSVCLAQNEKSHEWTVRGNLPPEKFVIQSHRGAGVLAPENTLEAFELGW